jgi:tRNA dimethylallyltransferase
MSTPRLLAIGGPTASGKTALAIALARNVRGEIVNADSRQVYRGMDIGTAKPSVTGRAAVPHHLFDIVDPRDDFSLALYLRLVHQTIKEIGRRGNVPILVGGTGLYLRAVTSGYQVPEVPPNVSLRRRLEADAAQRGHTVLLDRLRGIDPETASRIDVRNIRRVIRAIEVTETLGVPLSALQSQSPSYDTLSIILEADRTMLFERAAFRLTWMLQNGFLEEVSALLSSGVGIDLPSMSALGYRELARHLFGEIGYDEAIEATRLSTRSFIKRQLTWFRGERTSHHLQVEEPDLVGATTRLFERWIGAEGA